MGPGGSGTVAMTEEQEEEEERNVPENQDLINVEGTKIIMSKVTITQIFILIFYVLKVQWNPATTPPATMRIQL